MIKIYFKNMIWRIRYKWWAVKGYIKAQYYRYRTVHPRTLPGNLWIDRDQLLYHCMFEILAQFVEKELRPLTMVDIEKEEDPVGREMFQRQYNDEQEMLRLYAWWKKRVVEEESDNALTLEEVGLMTSEQILALREKEKAKEQELLDNCKRLIDVSPSMWT